MGTPLGEGTEEEGAKCTPDGPVGEPPLEGTDGTPEGIDGTPEGKVGTPADADGNPPGMPDGTGTEGVGTARPPAGRLGCPGFRPLIRLLIFGMIMPETPGLAAEMDGPARTSGPTTGPAAFCCVTKGRYSC